MRAAVTGLAFLAGLGCSAMVSGCPWGCTVLTLDEIPQGVFRIDHVWGEELRLQGEIVVTEDTVTLDAETSTGEHIDATYARQ